MEDRVVETAAGIFEKLGIQSEPRRAQGIIGQSHLVGRVLGLPGRHRRMDSRLIDS